MSMCFNITGITRRHASGFVNTFCFKIRISNVVGWNHYCHLIILIMSCALCFCHNVLGHVLAVCSISLPKAWWRHQMETFFVYWPFVRGIHGSPVNSPHKGQWRGALMISLICVWTNGWANTRDAGDLRRHRAHYDVTVMASRLGLAVRTYLRAL